MYPELSYALMGAAFTVSNSLPWGLPEKDYQKAFASTLETQNIKFRREVYIPVRLNDVLISKYYADFVVEEKVVIEFKVLPTLGYVNARQVLTYLQAGGYKLGILIYFTKDGVKYRRILNAH